MLTQTTVLIVTIVLAVIAALIVLVSVLRGMKRSLLRGGMSILVAAVCIPIAILLSQLIAKALVGVVLGMLDAEMMQMIVGDLPTAPEAAQALVKMLLAPLMVVPIFLLFYLVRNSLILSRFRYAISLPI